MTDVAGEETNSRWGFFAEVRLRDLQVNTGKSHEGKYRRDITMAFEGKVLDVPRGQFFDAGLRNRVRSGTTCRLSIHFDDEPSPLELSRNEQARDRGADQEIGEAFIHGTKEGDKPGCELTIRLPVRDYFRIATIKQNLLRIHIGFALGADSKLVIDSGDSWQTLGITDINLEPRRKLNHVPRKQRAWLWTKAALLAIFADLVLVQFERAPDFGGNIILAMCFMAIFGYFLEKREKILTYFNEVSDSLFASVSD